MNGMRYYLHLNVYVLGFTHYNLAFFNYFISYHEDKFREVFGNKCNSNYTFHYF